MQTLQLRLIRSHGDAADAAWPLVPGRDLTMDDAFAASHVAVASEQLAEAGQCRVHSAGATPGGGAVWWLSNGSSDLVCTVNQQRLARGERVRLNEGDTVELGLLQFVVEARAPATHAAGRADMPVAETSQSSTPTRGPDVYADFELTDLLRAEPASRRADGSTQQALQAKASRQLIDAHANPFTDITDVSYRIDVVQPDASLTAAPLSAEQPHEGPEAVQAMVEPNDLVADAPVDAAADVMRHLHAEYLRLMHNPGEPVAAMNWSLRDNPPERADQALHDLTKDAERFESLYDILGHGAGIQTILDSLDTLSDTNLLAEDPKVNVLRLFAPEDLLMQETRLPGLTLREHHALSADSAAALDLMRPDQRAGGASHPGPSPAAQIDTP